MRTWYQLSCSYARLALLFVSFFLVSSAVRLASDEVKRRLSTPVLSANERSTGWQAKIRAYELRFAGIS